MLLNTPPAHPHATGGAMYPALLQGRHELDSSLPVSMAVLYSIPCYLCPRFTGFYASLPKRNFPQISCPKYASQTNWISCPNTQGRLLLDSFSTNPMAGFCLIPCPQQSKQTIWIYSNHYPRQAKAGFSCPKYLRQSCWILCPHY